MNELSNLYSIDREINRIIFESMDEETGELLPETFERLESLEVTKGELIKNLTLKYKEINSFISVISEESKRLANLKKVTENNLERIKNYLLNNVKEKESNELYSISFRNSEAIEVGDLVDFDSIEILYPEMIRVKKEIDKTEAKRVYKETGILPDGITFVERKSIIIK